MFKSILVILIFLISSCKEKWDPDKQFLKQNEEIRSKKERYEYNVEQNTINRLREYEVTLLYKIKPETPLNKLNDLIGFKYSLLALNNETGTRWERRLYLWQDIIENKRGQTSLEYKICQKEKDFVIITCNEQSIVEVEFL